MNLKYQKSFINVTYMTFDHEHLINAALTENTTPCMNSDVILNSL